jgi:hypothetical protein
LIKKLAKEPLVHFLLAGAALFIVFEFVVKQSPYDASKRIVVNGEALLDFLQYSSRSNPPDRLDDLSPEELGRLIDTFVREEVLFREAKALGLDTKDYGVRRQLIRRLDSVNQMVVSSSIQLSESDLTRTVTRFPPPSPSLMCTSASINTTPRTRSHWRGESWRS